MSPKERSILTVLTEKPGAVVSRTRLLVASWGDHATDPHLLEVAIGRLRRWLGLAGRACSPSPAVAIDWTWG